jgi:hypothetical protein
VKKFLASSKSSSPRSAIIWPTHPYLVITSSRRDFYITKLVFFRRARPSTWWFVGYSRATAKYFIWSILVRIATRSTIHLKFMVEEKVGWSASQCLTPKYYWHLSQVWKYRTISLYIPCHQYFLFIFENVSQIPWCPAHSLAWMSTIIYCIWESIF